MIVAAIVHAAGFHKGHRIGRGHMLEHDFQFREVRDHAGKHLVDEDSLPVEDIDLRVGHLAMNQQRHADALHGFQNGADIGDIGDPVAGIRRGIGRVELAGGEHAGGVAALDLARVDIVGQIAGHQRREVRARFQRGQYPVAIGLRRRHRGHRRDQIRHDNGAGELPGRCDGPPRRASARRAECTCQSSGRRMVRLSVGMNILRGFRCGTMMPFPAPWSQRLPFPPFRGERLSD